MNNVVSSGMYRKIRSGVLLAFVAIVSTGCAHMGEERVKGAPTPSYTVPFSISFDRQGKPVILDQKGEQIRPEAVHFPVKAQEVVSMETFSAIKVKGSCFYLLEFGGNIYQIPLPPATCL